MDEILVWLQEAPVGHGHIAGDLDHPALIGMWRHPRHRHFAAGQMNEKQDVVGH
jgi:hypothetical protein